MDRAVSRGISIVLTGLSILFCAPGPARSGEKTLFEELSVPLIALAPKPVEFTQPSPRPQAAPTREVSSGFFRDSAKRCRGLAGYGLPRIVSDYRNLYNGTELLNFGVALGGAAILANTSLDEEFQDWYQREIGIPKRWKYHRFVEFVKGFGERDFIVPLALTVAIGYRYFQTVDPIFGRVPSPPGEFFARVTRSYLAGTPLLLMGQYTLGATRPGKREDASHWRFFSGKMNGISGHAFLGSIPFLTAMHMTDNDWLKSMFFIGSFFTGWSRLHDNDHYLSQVLLGWYVGYLSVRAVSKTEGTKLPRGLRVFPVFDGDGVGLGFSFRR